MIRLTVICFGLMILFSMPAAQATSLEQELRSLLRERSIHALKPIPNRRPALYRLGKALFSDTILSGNRNISCETCHHPQFASGDGLPLSIGEGGFGDGDQRQMGQGRVIPRHSPILFNLGAEKVHRMFWDGRVRMHPVVNTFTTPEPQLNGSNPARSDFTRVLTSALSAQALFPPTSHDEMRGLPGTNEIADAKTNFEVWERLTRRLMNTRKYPTMFRAAFPGTTQFNFAHAAEALAEFEKIEFSAVNTPFDRFMRGDRHAMTDDQMKGAILFYSSARCFKCHAGPNMSDFHFHNVGFPQMGPGKNPDGDDLGLYNHTNDPKDRYRFRTPPLRNIALTAPYGHAGTFKTIREVLRHYQNPKTVAERYQPTFDSLPYLVQIETNRAWDRFYTIDPEIKQFGLPLTLKDMDHLEAFLSEALTDPRFQH